MYRTAPVIAAYAAATAHRPPATGHWYNGAGQVMGRIIAIASQKGGVGKTTTAVNLAAAWAERQRRVLLIDLDPQANATASLGLSLDGRSTYDVLLGTVSLREAAVPVGSAGRQAGEGASFDLVPSSMDLAGATIELVELTDRDRRLASHLAAVHTAYDYALIDCPPALGLLTINALAAADTLLVPVQCEYLALEGLTDVLRTLRSVHERLNPALRAVHLVLTMYDLRTNLSRQVSAEVQRHFPRELLKTVIPRTVRLGEAPSYGQSVLAYDPTGRAAAAYRALGAELEEVLTHAAT